MRLKIIVNPSAGGGRARQATMTIKKLLYKTDIEFDLKVTKREGEGASIAAMAEQEGYDTVAVAGGDGTVAEVIKGVFGTHLAVLILPMGNNNAFASSLGMADNYVKILDKIQKAVVERVDLVKIKKLKEGKSKDDMPGTPTEKVAILYAGAGPEAFFKTKVIKPGQKPAIDYKALWDIAQSMIMGHMPVFQTTIMDPDGNEETLEGNVVIVGNAPEQGGHLSLTREADMTDGMLDIISYKKGTFIDTVKSMVPLFKNEPKDGELGFSRRQATRVVITLSKGGFEEKLFIDGRPAFKFPVEIECLAGQVSLLKVT